MELNIKKMVKCIVISGIDGSGKSTIINETQKALETDGKKDPAKIRQIARMLKQINMLEAYKKEREADF